MSPRNLEGIVAKKDLEAASIIRAGIPYGPKVSQFGLVTPRK